MWDGLSNGVAPHAGAWIETWISSTAKALFESHPTRVRGLKPAEKFRFGDTHVAPHAGAWIETLSTASFDDFSRVAPHAGAWIETFFCYRLVLLAWSHPTRVRGLKHCLVRLR